jgi:Tfp pilus assembly protein PilF
MQTVIDMDSSNVSAREDLANIYVDMGKAKEMDVLYASVLAVLPENPSILNNYAFALSRLNMDLDRAMIMVDKALKQEKSAAFLDTKAWILYRQGKYKQALKWIDKALTFSDAGAEVLYHQGKILIALGRLDEARDSLERSLVAQPNNPDVFNALEELK